MAALAATLLAGPLAVTAAATGDHDHGNGSPCPVSERIPVYAQNGNPNHHFICADDVPAGPQGPAGKDGVDGTDGEDGATGPAGPAGPQGEVGPQGPKGDTGATGATGAQGPAGPQGEQGDATSSTGAQGIPGPAGKDGKDGVTKTIIVENGEETEVPGLPATGGSDNTLEIILIALGLLVVGTGAVYYFRNR